jgi:two-component system phosphate regulon sensor histidine kinase PhoR
VGEAVLRAVNVYRYRVERESAELLLDVAPDLPRTRIDERALQLAVINLVDNALKYGAPPSPGDTKIVVQAQLEANAICVRVVDNGPGVPPEDRHRIFERFVRGTTSRTGGRAPARGSGIGLALVKHIAESHGGRAWVEPATGARGGACFAFTIPVRRPRDGAHHGAPSGANHAKNQ